MSPQGEIDHPIDALDDMLPGLLMLSLYRETGEERYKIAAQTIRKRFDTYPRTQDGGFWHGAAAEHQHQLWLDGMYMSMPFLVQYGEAFGDQKYAYQEATKQLLLYAGHLNDPKSGLFFHAYDETGTQSWAVPGSHHSSFFWARSIGWYGMALVQVLETMPKNDLPGPGSSLWCANSSSPFNDSRIRRQVSGTTSWISRRSRGIGWRPLHPRCTSTLSRSLWREAMYRRVTLRWHVRVIGGILAQLSATVDGDVSVAGICAGTVVGELSYYLKRPRNTNDIHGLGPLLLMNEQMRQAPCVRRMRAR